MMDDPNSTNDTRVKIWQQNLGKSNIAQQEMIVAATPSKWDILALQEPWIDPLGNTRANSKWCIIYPTPSGQVNPTPQIHYTCQHKVPLGISHANTDRLQQHH